MVINDSQKGSVLGWQVEADCGEEVEIYQTSFKDHLCEV